MKPITSRRRAGFTMLEIMLVIAIIVVLLGFAINRMGGGLSFAKETRAKADIQSIGGSLTLYSSMNGFLPTTSQGLKALVEKPEGEPKPRNWRKLMEEVPRDPWEMEYQYAQPGTHGTAYDLYSAGEDRKPGTEDDIGNWRKE